MLFITVLYCMYKTVVLYRTTTQKTGLVPNSFISFTIHLQIAITIILKKQTFLDILESPLREPIKIEKLTFRDNCSMCARMCNPKLIQKLGVNFNMI